MRYDKNVMREISITCKNCTVVWHPTEAKWKWYRGDESYDGRYAYPDHDFPLEKWMREMELSYEEAMRQDFATNPNLIRCMPIVELVEHRLYEDGKVEPTVIDWRELRVQR